MKGHDTVPKLSFGMDEVVKEIDRRGTYDSDCSQDTGSVSDSSSEEEDTPNGTDTQIKSAPVNKTSLSMPEKQKQPEVWSRVVSRQNRNSKGSWNSGRRPSAVGPKVQRLSMQSRKGRFQTRSLFVYNVPKRNCADDILKYVENCGVKVVDLQVKCHPEARWRSYRITISQDNFQEMRDEVFWPRGIRVREYRERSC